MLTKADILNHMRKNVDLSFQNSKSEFLQHPKKKHLKPKRVMTLIPNFEDIDKE